MNHSSGGGVRCELVHRLRARWASDVPYPGKLRFHPRLVTTCAGPASREGMFFFPLFFFSDYLIFPVT